MRGDCTRGTRLQIAAFGRRLLFEVADVGPGLILTPRVAALAQKGQELVCRPKAALSARVHLFDGPAEATLGGFRVRAELQNKSTAHGASVRRRPGQPRENSVQPAVKTVRSLVSTKDDEC